MELPAGTYLKEIRKRLHLGLRDVQQASAIIAEEEKNDEFYISAARLAQIENECSAPSVCKIVSLSAIYGLDFLDILRRYGVVPDRIHYYRSLLQPATTRLVAAEIYDNDRKVPFPVRLDPSFRWETTHLLNRVVALWGELPAAFLMNASPRRHMYGYVGLDDKTMSPLLRPGALVMIDGDRRRVLQREWDNEFERPIYFLEMRDGYRCGWCQVHDGRITLVPHPMSGVPAETFSFPNDAEIVGQVVGAAMRLVPACNGEREPKSAALLSSAR